MRAVLDLQGVPYAINDLRLRVDCEFYSDFDQLLALARVANDRTLKTNLIAEFNGQMRPVLFSSGPIGLKCRYYPNELKMREDELRGAHYFVDVSLQTDESITDARKKLLRAGIPHHVEGNQIWIPCEIYQSIRIFDEVQGLRAGYGKVDEDSYTQISDLKLLLTNPGLFDIDRKGPWGLNVTPTMSGTARRMPMYWFLKVTLLGIQTSNTTWARCLAPATSLMSTNCRFQSCISGCRARSIRILIF